MLGGVEVGDLHRLGEIGGDDDARLGERGFGGVRPGEGPNLPADLGLHRVGEGGGGGYQHHLGRGVVLGLA